MKLTTFFTFILLAPLTLLADGSCDYLEKRFAIIEDTALVYGVAPKYNLQNDTLKLDLFKPIDDRNFRRPLLVYIHGGGFAAGSRRDDAHRCRNFAARGYVVATISYRLGFVPPLLLDEPWAFDRAEVLRAMYRAMQDARGAIRWLKARHATDSTDTANVFVAGGSAGAITALAVGFLVSDADKPAEADSVGEIFNTYTFHRPDLGPVQGTLNVNGYNANVKAVGNLLGAIIDTARITIDGPAVVSYHQKNDPIVACYTNQPYWGVGLGVNANYPWMHGSAIIDHRLGNLGYPAEKRCAYLHDGNTHDVHSEAFVDTLIAGFFSRLICGNGQAIRRLAGQAARKERYHLQIGNSRMHIPADARSVRLFSITGRLIGEFSVEKGFSKKNRTSFAAGAYLVRIRKSRTAASIPLDENFVTPVLIGP